MKEPKREGYLLIGDETICVYYHSDLDGTSIQKRPCGVLGYYLKRESLILQRDRLATLQDLRKGEEIQL